MIRRLLSACALAALFVVAPGCHAPVTITTAQGKTAFTADQIVQRVNELQSAAIQANGAGGLATSTTRTIVTFCVAADQTLAATPAGWQASVSAAWASAKTQLPVITNPAVAAAISAVDVVLAAVGS
jgi:hypothetical protein